MSVKMHAGNHLGLDAYGHYGMVPWLGRVHDADRGGESMRYRVSIALLLLLSLAGGCGDDTESGADASTSEGTPSPSSTVASPSSIPFPLIVGRWKQPANVHTCENFVRSMDEEGLLAAVESSPPYVPGDSWQRVAKRFCKGPQEDWDVAHYHFFDAEGLFGSLNQDEQQVDDATYTILGTHTVKIGQSKFRYTVHGNTLTMDPVITAAQRQEALAKPGGFADAVWMVAVAVPGTSWSRVDCGFWC